MESVEQSKRERLARAFIEGAETGMVECRGYGLSASEREEAERLADYLCRKPLEEVAVAS